MVANKGYTLAIYSRHAIKLDLEPRSSTMRTAQPLAVYINDR